MIDRQIATSERNVSRPSTKTPVVPRCNDQFASQHLKFRIQNGCARIRQCCRCLSGKRLILPIKVQAAADRPGDAAKVKAEKPHRVTHCPRNG